MMNSDHTSQFVPRPDSKRRLRVAAVGEDIPAVARALRDEG